MNAGDVSTIHYWIDIAVKAAIGVVVSIVGMDYRSVKNSLHELEETKYTMRAEIQVMQSELTYIKDRLEKIDKKLDRVLDK